MIRWIAIPFYTYMLLLPILAFMTSIGGRDAVGKDAITEYLILLQIVLFVNIFLFIRKKGGLQRDLNSV